MTHGVIGNTSDFGSAESWFEPRWVNKKSEIVSGSECNFPDSLNREAVIPVSGSFSIFI